MIIRQSRPEDATGIARAHVRTWQTTYRGIIPDNYLDTIPVEEWQVRWKRDLSIPRPGQFVYVAENEENGEIAGFVWGGVTRYPDLPYQGELYAIYVLKNYQKHGLGRFLVQALTKALLDEGLSSMFLWVFEANLASRRFYEALGGQYIKSNTFEIHGTPVVEYAYGWADIHSLIQDTRT